MSSEVDSLTSVGSDLYAGGYFGSAGGVANTQCIAKWNGTVWSALAGGFTCVGAALDRSVLAILAAPHLSLS